MHGSLADTAGGAWTFGGSILTFAFPMILFIVVAGALYVLYTKPEFVPGHPAPRQERPVSYTAVPGRPAVQHEQQATPAETAGTAEASAAEASAGEPAGTEDAE
jgi:hypothetical protein